MIDLVRGRKILEMIPRLIERTNGLAGAEDLVVEMGVDDYVSTTAAAMGTDQMIGDHLIVPINPSQMVEVRPREDAEPDRLYVFRREDAPS